MSTPSEFLLMVVRPGTEVHCSGSTVTVWDDRPARLGLSIYLTPKLATDLKGLAPEPRRAALEGISLSR